MQEMSKTKEYVIMVMVGMVMKDGLIKGMVRIVMEYMCKMGWMMMTKLRLLGQLISLHFVHSG